MRECNFGAGEETNSYKAELGAKAKPRGGLYREILTVIGEARLCALYPELRFAVKQLDLIAGGVWLGDVRVLHRARLTIPTNHRKTWLVPWLTSSHH